MKTIKSNCMQTLFEYMIKITAVYAAAWLFYWLLLSRLTSYKSNRFYLLAACLFAFIIPLLRLDYFVEPQIISTSRIINNMPAIPVDTIANAYIPGEDNNPVPVVLITLFISGVVVCLLHFIMQLISFKKITANAVLIYTTGNIKLYHLDIDIMPFSFGRNIYVNRNRHTTSELNDIIQHEMIHAQQNHTVDVVIAECICMLNWYNPFAWLLKNAVKQNLEFLTDDTVLKNGIDKKSYQYLLLKVTGYSPVNIASSFKISSLKQRIYMMNKTRTSQRHLLKMLFVLPLIAFMMLAFRNDGQTHIANTPNKNDETFMLSELIYNIPDADINQIITNTRDKSLLQSGKPFTIKTIKNERDRLRLLLEKNGYSSISSHAITFLIDSTFDNNRCAIEINIDLKRKELSFNNSKLDKAVADKVEDSNTADISVIKQTGS